MFRAFVVRAWEGRRRGGEEHLLCAEELGVYFVEGVAAVVAVAIAVCTAEEVRPHPVLPECIQHLFRAVHAACGQFVRSA